tara:strand:- start:33 stop:854 length:822 start_codon:yes stop_codon:yes gene_type:complete
MALFGSAFVVGKLVLNTTLPPILFGAIRMLIVFICLLPFWRFEIPNKKYFILLVIFSLSMGVLVTLFMYLAIEKTSIVSPIIIGAQLTVPVGIILSSIFLNEKISYKKWFFVLTSFCGIILIGFDPEILNNILTLILTALMAFFYAVANVVSRQIRDISVITQTAFMSLIGFIILFFISYYFEGNTINYIKNLDFNTWLLILHAAIAVSLIAHMSLFYLYRFYTVGTVFPFYSLFPIFGLIQTFLIFGEIPSALVTLGGIIVIGSVFILQKIR